MLLFMDGFDHYVTADITVKWTAINGGSVSIGAFGRRSSNGLRCNGGDQWVAKSPLSPAPSGNLVVFGVGMLLNDSFAGLTFQGNPVGQQIGVRLSGSHQWYLAVKTTGAIELRRGDGTLLGTTSLGLTQSVYHYIEGEIVTATSGATAKLWIDGVQALDLTGLNTANSGSNGWDTFRLASGQSMDTRFDDVYLCDGSGSLNITRRGDCRVDALYPTGAGANTGFTPLSGSNYQMVDETAPDADTTYNLAATAALKDTFPVTDAAAPGADIYGVQLLASARKLDASAAGHTPVIRIGSTDYDGTEQGLAQTYDYIRQMYEQTPEGSPQDWTSDIVNAAEFGYKKST